MFPALSRRAALALPLLIPGRAARSAWPDRPVRLVVAFAAGGAADTIARLLQPRLAEALGQPLVVENRPGAGGTIAAVAVARSAPDGTTLLLDALSHSVAPLLFPNLAVDYATAFTPVGRVTVQPYVLAVRADLPVWDMPGFVAYARSRGQPVVYGTPGNASAGQLAAEALAHALGLRLQHLPYRGGAEAMNDVAAGTLEAACVTLGSATPIAEAGRARLLGLTSTARFPGRPEVPTIAETVLPGFDVTSWNGVLGPAGLPPAVVERLGEAIFHACGDGPTQARLLAAGFQAAPSTPAEFARQLARDSEVYGAIVRRAGIRS